MGRDVISGIGGGMSAMEEVFVAREAPEEPIVWSVEDDRTAFIAVARRAFVEDVPLVIFTVEGYEVLWMVTGVEVDGVWGYDQGQAVFALTLRRLEKYGDMPPLFLPRERIATMVAAVPDSYGPTFGTTF